MKWRTYNASKVKVCEIIELKGLPPLLGLFPAISKLFQQFLVEINGRSWSEKKKEKSKKKPPLKRPNAVNKFDKGQYSENLIFPTPAWDNPYWVQNTIHWLVGTHRLQPLKTHGHLLARTWHLPCSQIAWSLCWSGPFHLWETEPSIQTQNLWRIEGGVERKQQGPSGCPKWW